MAGKTYLNLLSLLMFNRAYDSKTFSVLFGNDFAASKYRQKLLREEHAKKQTLVLKEKKQRSVTLFTLTRKGYQYLTEHEPNITHSLCLNELDESIPLRSEFETKTTAKLRLIRRTKALTVAVKAGAYVPVENYTVKTKDVRPDGDYGMAEYIAENINVKDYETIDLYRQSKENFPFVFHNDTCIKAVAGNVNETVSVKDGSSGRYSGVIDSQLKSILLYVAPVYGMSWTTWLVQREVASYSVWTKLKSIAEQSLIRHNGRCAALIVDNARRFAELYKNTDEARIDKKCSFGDPFDHFYIIPADTDGPKHLRWLLTTNDDEMNRDIIASAIKSGMYSKNSRFKPGLFPLLSEDNNPTAIGFQFDTKHLQRVENEIVLNPSVSFTLLCFDWQEDYYKRVLPENVTIVPLPMEE